MSFNHPEFLYGLFALLIPVIIHLFNFRRYKKLWFSNIEFLKNITAETRKQNKLKHLIVLMLRLFAIAFIVLAFAGPEWGKAGKNQNKAGEKLRAVYIDNSFSMMAEGKNGQLFHEAINKTQELIKQSTRETRFALLSNEASGGKNTLNKEAAYSKLQQMAISPAYRKMSSVIQSGLNLVKEKETGKYELFLYSDFQKNAFDAENFPADSLGNYYFIPLEQGRNSNIYVDSCWITTPVLIPGKHAELMIRMKNVSGENYEKVPLTVSINGQQKAVAGVNLKAGSTEIVKVSFLLENAGWHKGLIEIEDYPITFDDRLYFSFHIKQNLKVLEVYDKKASTALQLFYQSDSVFQFEKVNYRRIDYNKLNNFKLIILNGLPSYSSGLLKQLNSYQVNGGNILLIPQAETNLTEENKFLSRFQAGKITGLDTAKSRVVRIKRSNELFKESISKIPENADLPTVNRHFRFKYLISSGMESLVSLLNGDDFLLKKHSGNGQLFLLSVPLDESFSNFSRQALFVPVMYGTVVSGGLLSRLFYTLKKDEVLNTDISVIPYGETPFHLQKTSSDFSFIPEQQSGSEVLRLFLRNDNLKTDGFYNLMIKDSVWQVFAFNFDRNESQTTYYSPEEISAKLSTSGLLNFEVVADSDNTQTNVINSLQKASKLWMLFIIFALLMLLAEVLVLRFWKK